VTYVPPVPPCQPPANPGFYSEAVIICDKYHDFLGKTLPHNKYQFNKLVVVTSYEDKETQRICEHWHVECVKTDVLETRKGHFCKGKGINVGLEKLSLKGWVTHMDADILLPPQTKIILENADLNPQHLYGIDRFNIRGYKSFAKFLDMPKLQHECNTYIHVDKYPVGTRIMHAHAGGYVPLGFFQMWNPNGSGVFRYPEGHTDAGREDTVFSQLWPRRDRTMIPEIIGYHLESDDADMAANWNGRTTSPFEYEV
jgi:hypothetical protein